MYLLSGVAQALTMKGEQGCRGGGIGHGARFSTKVAKCLQELIKPNNTQRRSSACLPMLAMQDVASVCCIANFAISGLLVKRCVSTAGLSLLAGLAAGAGLVAALA